MTHEQCNELFVESYYDELPPDARAEFDRHVGSCQDCAAAYRRLTESLRLMDQRERIELDEKFAADYWERLKTRIESDSTPASISPVKPLTLRPPFMPSWAYGIAAILLIAVGIYLGKLIFVSGSQGHVQPQNEQKLSSTVVPDTLSNEEMEKRVNAYLDRSKVLLLGLINAPSEQSSPAYLAKQQQVSRELIQQASFLETRLKDADLQRLRQVIGDLQLILRELANYSAENGVPLVELVKQGVDKKSILLKINLAEIRALDTHASHEKKTKQEIQRQKI